MNQYDVGIRIENRNKLLKDLYNWNFANSGREKMVTSEVNEDTENHLGFEYLHQKGLIDYKVSFGGRERTIITANAKITARGIDVIEKEILVENV